MVNLEKIKADIAARKAMPAWGANTSIERIKTINATLPSFSLKTVEALVEMLDKTQSANAAQDDHINQQQDSIDRLEKKNAELGKYVAELESRTVKLPPKIERDDADGWFMYKGGRVGGGAAEWYNKALDDVSSSLTAVVTVKLPEPFKMAKSSSGLTYYYADEVNEALTAAGIKWETE